MQRSCVTRIQILEMGRKWTSRGGSGLGPNMKRIQRRMIFRLHHLTGIVLPAVRINDDSAVSVHFLAHLLLAGHLTSGRKHPSNL
jgi:hypothetical protein